jgi:molecular chaperone DnaK
VLVYDLGGGTFDVSVVQFHGDDAEVLATAGDHRLGGKDWDDLIVDLVAELLESELGEDPRDDPGVLVELQERAREAKHALSRLEQTAVTIHAGGRIHRVEVDRRTFWGRAQALFDRTEDLVTRVLGDLGGASRVDEVLLAGGSTRMPPCTDIVERVTGHAPLAGVDADEAVVTGAALFASRLRRGQPGDSGPSRALGGRIRDVTAHALGFVVVAADGKRYVNEVMIPRNAPLPSSATKRHSLDLSGSRAGGVLSVYMLQGEAERPLDADALGCWTFKDIPGQPRSSVDVSVSYRYDEDGVVEVSASVDGHTLRPPVIDRDDRDLRWTEEDPSEGAVAEVVVALVIDVSVSMRGSKLEEAKAACLGFIDELDSAGLGDHLALVSFGSVARTIARVGDDPSSTRRAVKALKIDGSTDLAAGLHAADAQLRPHDYLPAVVGA